MKIRTDFVTNSSSSSFILAFHDKDDGINQISSMMEGHASVYKDILLHDFENEKPIPYDQIAEHCKKDFGWAVNFLLEFGDGGWWSGTKDTFEKRWMTAHPGASYQDFRNSEEYKVESERLIAKYTEEMMERIGDKRYLVELEYGDHDDVGSELEHYILPDCDFTVRMFSHH